MSDSSWIQAEIAQALVDDVVSALVRRYRIDAAPAKKAVEDAFAKSGELRQVVERETSPPKITRTRAYKDAVAAIKRNIYYGLRRYSADSGNQNDLITQLSTLAGAPHDDVEAVTLAIAKSHASTRERLADRVRFYEQLLSLLDNPKTILDVGSGMQPILFPFDALAETMELYLALDKDPASVAAVNAYAKATTNERLIAARWNIRDGWESINELSRVSTFDAAFLFKLVPVVERQQPHLLDILSRTPAKKWVITGSKISLTKRQDIERRERSVIQCFCVSTGRRVSHEFSTSEEFGLILE